MGIPLHLIVPLALGIWQQTAPAFTVHLTDGTTTQGHAPRVANGWLSLQSTDPRRWPIAEVVWLQATARAPSAPLKPYLLLTSGDRVPGNVLAVDNTAFHFQPTWSPGAPWTVPLSNVRGWWQRIPAGVPAHEPWRWAWEHVAVPRDRIHLQNGDSLDGVLESMKDGRWQVRTGLTVETLPSADLAAVRLTDVAAPGKPERPAAAIVLFDGMRLSLKEVAVGDDDEVTGQTVFGMRVRFPLRDVARLEFAAAAPSLADHTPITASHEPYLDERRPPVRHGSVTRRWLRLDGEPFDCGLGMATTSEVSYDLPPRYDVLMGLVGVDDNANLPDRARVRVLLDGREAFAHVLSVKAPPTALRVRLGGAKRISLRTELIPGSRGPAAVNWVGLWMLRTPGR